MTEEIHTTVCF